MKWYHFHLLSTIIYVSIDKNMVDEQTFRKLEESEYNYPEITEVLFDHKIMLSIVSKSIDLAIKGYDTVWDTIMCKFICKYYQDGIHLVEKQIKEKGLKSRLIVEITKENIDFISSIKYHDIRHIDGLRSNFGIFDNRAYMVYIFTKENEFPDQTLWSNSKVLVDMQQALFNKLWEISIPLYSKIDEMKYEEKNEYQQTLKGYKEIQNEINSIIKQTRKELIVFSSIKILNYILNNDNFLNLFSSLLKKKVKIKILTDGINFDFIGKIKDLNKENFINMVHFRYTNKLENIDEFIIIKDNKILLNAKYNNNEYDFIAFLSNEQNKIWVQEIMFEKYWNETSSLAIENNN
jgi:hypothetical protein